MSINFEDDMSPEAARLIRKTFGENLIEMDKRTALLEKIKQFDQKDFKELANVAKQPVTVEMNSIGDRKEVGGLVYELDENGWKRLPIGTLLEK